MHNALKKLKYIGEYIALKTAFLLFSLLPPERASATGGRIGRFVGPRLGVSKKALRNLRRAFPERSEESCKTIAADMWDNLGRLLGEYPHLEDVARHNVEIANPEILEKLRGVDGPLILFGAHLGNWELMVVTLYIHGLGTHAVVRAPNNPMTARLLERQRSLDGKNATIAKSSAGARQMMRTLKEGRRIGILIDQKYNEGVPAPFFGRAAMTSPAFVELAQRFRCPLVPVRFERLEGMRFRLTFYDPLPVFDGDGSKRPPQDCIADAHALLEQWIRKRPEQWIWIHRRWKPGSGAIDEA